MIEIFLIGAIILFIFFYTGKINTGKFVADNRDLIMLLKESDYDFLLYAKYGDRVYDPDAVFVKRIRDGLLALAFCLFLFMYIFSTPDLKSAQSFAIFLIVGIIKS